MSEPTLYERLGGVFAIAAVIDHFSDAVVQNPIVGQKSENPALREWHTNNLGRLPGLKFMRTLWVCNVAGGPFQFSATRPGSTVLGLEEAHRELKISPEEFDEVAAELHQVFDVPLGFVSEAEVVAFVYFARPQSFFEDLFGELPWRHERQIAGEGKQQDSVQPGGFKKAQLFWTPMPEPEPWA